MLLHDRLTWRRLHAGHFRPHRIRQNQIRAFLRDHHRRRIDVARRDVREHRRIDDPQRLGLLMEYAEQGTLRQVLDAKPGMAKAARRLLIRGILRATWADETALAHTDAHPAWGPESDERAGDG